MTTVIVDATEARTIYVPDPTVVMDRTPPPPPPVGFTPLALGVAAVFGIGVGFYAHRAFATPRSNPSCCASCARGGPCGGRRR